MLTRYGNLGKLDDTVPPCQGEELARRLGNNAVLYIGEDDTHASIGIPFGGNLKQEYLENIIKHIGKAEATIEASYLSRY